MMDSPAQLMWGMLFGSIGLGYFIYGKKQHVLVPMLSGLGLMVYPYFISNTLALVATGVVISTLPYFFRF
ncbi:MAG TPA: hypothetical protein VFS17_09675 [Methylophilaceae bacterium]|nr:hypothetical protein [Methylophilaceae bacterium]